MATRDNAGDASAGLIVIGIYPDQETAARAIRELQDAGFTKDEVSAIMRTRGPDGDLLPEVVQTEGFDLEAQAIKTGAATGGVIGGLLGLLGSLLIPGLGPVTVGGVLLSTLLGAGVGVVSGGLMGMLVGMGFSQAEAEYFDSAVRSGGVLLLVQPAPARLAEARAVLTSAGGDLGPGPTGGTDGGAAAELAEVGGSGTSEPWRGPDRRHHAAASFTGPERRKA
jgi:hypothetical protein